MRLSRQKYYDIFSKFYDKFIELHSSEKQGKIKTTLAEQTGLADGDAVLDICTGTGTLLPFLRDKTGKNGRVIGLDFSKGMLKAARKKVAALNNIFLIQADVAHLPVKSSLMDAVTCTHAFYELKDESQNKCLLEIQRILKPEKKFLMMEHDLPERPVIRLLFYIRLMSMGFKKAVRILRHEKEILLRYFASVEKITTDTGRSKIWICRRG